MTRQSGGIGHILGNVIKTILLFFLKLAGIAIAWALKMSGEIILSVGQFLEDTVNKKH